MAMAMVVIRCRRISSSANSGKPSRSFEDYGAVPVLGSILFREGNAFTRLLKLERLRVSPLAQIGVYTSKEIFCNGPKENDVVSEKSCLLQGTLSSRHPGAALLVVNAFTLAAPLEALADTCEPNYVSLSMPIFLAVALIGATVGGLVARQRKGELQKVNEQLRQINAALRRQAKIESYAPNLSYAPAGRKTEQTVIVDPKQVELISHLKSGKAFLRNQNPGKATPEFQAALELARTLNDPTREKKAARGLGTALQRQGNYKEAIKYHSMVLDISKREGDDSGSTEAYGAIADCYTELGDLEQAGKFYDGYIQRLEADVIN